MTQLFQSILCSSPSDCQERCQGHDPWWCRRNIPNIILYKIREYLNHIEACFNDIRVVEVETEHFLHEEQPGTEADILNDFLVP